MDAMGVQEAAALLVEARRTGRRLDNLPSSCRPSTVIEAHAIQDAIVAILGDSVGGWKVGAVIDGKVSRGVLLQSLIVSSGTPLPAAVMPMLGVEAEIAFRFDDDLPPRNQAYTYEEVAEAVTAMAAIEVVDSRFKSYRDAPVLERMADMMSNGAFVHGPPQSGWRTFDLSKLHVELIVGGETIASQIGGHASGDPLLPAVALANDLRHAKGVRAGQIMTTGSYTGLNYAKPGQFVVARFDEFEAAEVFFDA